MTVPCPPSEARAALGALATPLTLGAEVVRKNTDLVSPRDGSLDLPAVALLSWYTLTRLSRSLEAHRGTYAGEPHWWAQYNRVIIDPTRNQFDDGPVISLFDEDLYRSEETFAAVWTTPELVIDEAQRAFLFAHIGRGWAEDCIEELLLLPK